MLVKREMALNSSILFWRSEYTESILPFNGWNICDYENILRKLWDSQAYREV